MGATGAQGGATVMAFNALKESGNGDYKIRAITRDPESEKAKTIEPLVDEIVKADAKDKDSMVEAFTGCYGVFILSNFWEELSASNELMALRNCKDALKEVKTVEHIVVSSFEDTRVAIEKAENKDSWNVIDEENGMYSPTCDAKGEAAREFHDEGLPVTTFYTSFYYENFIYFGMGPSRQSDSDPYAITLPIEDVKLPMVAVADIGKAACAIFQDSSLIGKTVGVMSEHLSGQEIADTFAKVCGQEVMFNAVPWNIYATFGFPGAADLANMFRYKVEYNEDFVSARVLSDSMKETMGGVISLESWVNDNKGAFQLEPKKEAAPTSTPRGNESGVSEWCTCVCM